jgi:xanthine dehydrogenase YagS FAD-binding subunit
MKNFEHVNAASVESALSSLGQDGRSRVIAGGTDLLTELKLGIIGPDRLINLKSIPGLDGIRFDESSGLRLGALATLTAIAAKDIVQERYHALYRAISLAASPQLRNRGTIGGNLGQDSRCWYYRGPFHCWLKGGAVCYARDGENAHHAIFGGGPCYTVHPSDPAPALIALGAEVSIMGIEGERTLSLEKLFQKPEEGNRRMTTLKPSEIIVGVQVPTPSASSRGTYLKAMERRVWTFAQASVAAQLTLEGDIVREARLVLGGVAPMPWRVRDAEAALLGKRLEDASIDRAADLCVAGTQPLAHNGYKIPLVKGIVKEGVASLRR